jgi:hypothetical protein
MVADVEAGFRDVAAQCHHPAPVTRILRNHMHPSAVRQPDPPFNVVSRQNPSGPFFHADRHFVSEYRRT